MQIHFILFENDIQHYENKTYPIFYAASVYDIRHLKEIKPLKSGTSVNFKHANGWVECPVTKVTDFEMTFCLFN